jgi:hypothetical protein
MPSGHENTKSLSATAIRKIWITAKGHQGFSVSLISTTRKQLRSLFLDRLDDVQSPGVAEQERPRRTGDLPGLSLSRRDSFRVDRQTGSNGVIVIGPAGITSGLLFTRGEPMFGFCGALVEQFCTTCSTGCRAPVSRATEGQAGPPVDLERWRKYAGWTLSGLIMKTHLRCNRWDVWF